MKKIIFILSILVSSNVLAIGLTCDISIRDNGVITKTSNVEFSFDKEITETFSLEDFKLVVTYNGDKEPESDLSMNLYTVEVVNGDAISHAVYNSKDLFIMTGLMVKNQNFSVLCNFKRN